MTKVTMHGKPLNTVKEIIKENERAQDFVAINQNMEEVSFSSFIGKPILLLSLPSLDTPVCSREAHRFNQEVGNMQDQMQIIAISMDLPFAQKRWCGQEGVKNVTTLSDYRRHDFGQKYGLLIREIGLLARAVFLIDEKGVIRKAHIINEITQEPNYQEILNEAKKLFTRSNA